MERELLEIIKHQQAVAEKQAGSVAELTTAMRELFERIKQQDEGREKAVDEVKTHVSSEVAAAVRSFELQTSRVWKSLVWALLGLFGAILGNPFLTRLAELLKP